MTIPITCGNNLRDVGEECDGGLNCVNCFCAAGYTSETTGIGCTVSPSTSSCNNGVRDEGEECDSDKNCIECMCIPGFQPASSTSTECVAKLSPNCGNNRRDGDEECDGGYQCSNCECNMGFVSADTGLGCILITGPPSTCGNRARDDGEECDGGTYCLNCACTKGNEPISESSVSCTKKFRDLIWHLDLPVDCESDEQLQTWSKRIHTWVASAVQEQKLDVEFTNKLVCDYSAKRDVSPTISTVTFAGSDVELAVLPGQIPMFNSSSYDDEIADNDEGLSGGAIAGIVIGVVVAVVVVVVIVLYVVKRKDSGDHERV
eukprot:TRINITY_DN3902_c0_g1_i1.p1 TRINITY_DN3902_c0_g1~~TRINITY_DN3902_c0_g1_i1.p1  ORF type:complete len:318 (+),score=54.32 TRINITY_DN3902_c0_g1_i1:2484-3437(+)